MATDYMVSDEIARPPALPEGSGPMCHSSWHYYRCTLDRGHEGTHIADGVYARCAEWDEEESE